MNTSSLFISLFFSFLLTSQVWASPIPFVLTPFSNNSQNHFKFSLKYTLGTHYGNATEGNGQILLDPQDFDQLQGQFKIPIHRMFTGNQKRDCHMRESLGLNYSLSRFPEDHVCDSQETLPSSGPDSIQYPYITFTLERGLLLSGNLSLGQESKIKVFGVWNIHGRNYKSVHEMNLSWVNEDQSQLRVQGKFDLSLADFDIHVKPANVLGLSIGVEDKVMVDLDFLLER